MAQTNDPTLAVPVRLEDFNPNARLLFGVTVEHVYRAMTEFIDFLGFINAQLATRDIPALESMLMPANFSSIVGEFIITAIPKYCPTIAKNRYHNGHPDLIPAGKYAGDASQYGHDGIEVKASRYLKSWQGHNAEASFLTVFCFEAARGNDEFKNIAPIPFRFLLVCGAQLDHSDWKFSGRSETSRRTITASVTDTGSRKMMQNWIYKAPVPADVFSTLGL